MTANGDIRMYRNEMCLFDPPVVPVAFGVTVYEPLADMIVLKSSKSISFAPTQFP